MSPSAIHHQPLFVLRPTPGPPKQPTSHRALHIQNVLALFHLSLLRADYPRARRAWRILAGLKEVGWESLWLLSGALTRDLEGGADERAELLEGLMRGGGKESVPLLQAYTQELLARDPPLMTKALDRLELYLPGQPFSTSPVLHALAGMCALGISVENRAAGAPPSQSHHRSALQYVHKALDLLPASAPDATRVLYKSLLRVTLDVESWGREAERSDSEEEEEKEEEEESSSGDDDDDEVAATASRDRRSRRSKSSSGSSGFRSAAGAVVDSSGSENDDDEGNESYEMDVS